MSLLHLFLVLVVVFDCWLEITLRATTMVGLTPRPH